MCHALMIYPKSLQDYNSMGFSVFLYHLLLCRFNIVTVTMSMMINFRDHCFSGIILLGTSQKGKSYKA